MLLGALAGLPASAAATAATGDAAAATAAEATPPEAWRPPWLGVPGGLTFDVHANAETDETFFFVRFAEARSGPVTVTLASSKGSEMAVLSGELEHGSIMLLWDGMTADGRRAGTGTFTARLDAGDVQAGVEFERP